MRKKLNISHYLDGFIKGYRYVVSNRYSYQYNNTPEAFPFMEEDEYKSSLVLLNEDFFEYPEVIIFTNDPSIENTYDLRKQDKSILSKNFTQFINEPETYVEKYCDILDTNNYIYFIDVYHFYEMQSDKVKDYQIEEFYKSGKRFARNHFDRFMKNSKEQMIDKTHEKVQPFNHLNLDELKNIVNDTTFSYQINQGIEAYKRELYLPAAATFAVAIESFLIQLKRANNIKHKDSDPTMYDKLLDNLKQKKKLNYRTKRRIEVAYNMRNIVSHTQAGAVAKNDCDFLLNTLKDVIDHNKNILLKYKELVNKTK